MKKALYRAATMAVAGAVVLVPSGSAFAIGTSVDAPAPEAGAGCKRHVVVDYTYGAPNPLTLSAGVDCH